jgi:hypothetical protein
MKQYPTNNPQTVSHPATAYKATAMPHDVS